MAKTHVIGSNIHIAIFSPGNAWFHAKTTVNTEIATIICAPVDHIIEYL